MAKSTIPMDSTVTFDKYPNVEIINDTSETGLSIIRPNKEPMQLNKVTKNNITVFYPYKLKNTKEHDKPSAVTNEYLFMREESIEITR